MISRSTSSRLWFFAALALVVCCSMLAVARADNVIPFYTGTFGAEGGASWSPFDDMIVGTEMTYNSATLNFIFDFSAPIENLQISGGMCAVNCVVNFTGTLGPGTVSFYGYDLSEQNPPYRFTGYIISGGTFSAQVVLCFPFDCAFDDTISFDFRSQSSNNGWWSTGKVDYMGGCVDGGCDGFGHLSINTFATPEPSSLLLLGSGIVAFGGFLRLKRTT